MATARAISVTNTAPVRLDPVVQHGPTTGLEIHNNGAVRVYLGGPKVSSTHGSILEPGARISMDIDRNDEIYGITASSTTEVRVLAVSV